MENVTYLEFRNKNVRDLAWAIGSCPLMVAEALPGSLLCLDEEWCKQQLSLHRDWMKSLDQDSSVLSTWLEEHNPVLIGKRFEALVGFWLTNSPHFNLISSNLTLQENGKTTGEIDFITEELDTGRILRMEVACKYYLGSHKSSEWKNWIGPNGIDNLELKLKKIPRQLSTKTVEISNSEVKLTPAWFLKGYFFHHYSILGKHRDTKWSDPHYNAGWFLRTNELNVISNEFAQWLILPREFWMSPYSGEPGEFEIFDGSEMKKQVMRLIQLHQKAQMVVQVQVSDNRVTEMSRGFVVKPSWPFMP
jgi:hypothetical protein